MPPPNGEDAGKLKELAARLRASGAFGRSGALGEVFDFLLDRSLQGSPPKEIEIAANVFGGSSKIDSGADTPVRVYVHRLRRKLAEYAAGEGASEPYRLAIPKGEYRLVLEPWPSPSTPPAQKARKVFLIVGAIAAIVIVGALNLGAWVFFNGVDGERLREARRSSLWQPVFANGKPILIVLGDYYIFGEGRGADIQRLVREFSINSAAELDMFTANNPSYAARYVDLDLRYLPVGVGFALPRILPFLIHSDQEQSRVRYALASDLNPEMMKGANIVYIGYFSGLESLLQPVMAGSRFEMGDTFDELIDAETNHRYVSQAGSAVGPSAPNRDYGYVSTFATPNGSRVVIIAGTRDIGLMQAAQEAVSAGSLKAIESSAKSAVDFEALYEVQGFGRLNLDGRMVLAAPLDRERIWSPTGWTPAPSTTAR